MSSQVRSRRGRDSLAHATWDFLVAFVVLAAVVGFVLDAVDAAAGGVLGELAFRLVVGTVAFAGSYPFVAGHLPRSLLWGFLRSYVLAFLVIAVLASLPLFASGGVPTDSFAARAIHASVVVVAGLLALVHVRRQSPSRSSRDPPGGQDI